MWPRRHWLIIIILQFFLIRLFPTVIPWNWLVGNPLELANEYEQPQVIVRYLSFELISKFNLQQKILLEPFSFHFYHNGWQSSCPNGTRIQPHIGFTKAFWTGISPAARFETNSVHEMQVKAPNDIGWKYTNQYCDQHHPNVSLV